MKANPLKKLGTLGQLPRQSAQHKSQRAVSPPTKSQAKVAGWRSRAALSKRTAVTFGPKAKSGKGRA